MTKLTLIVDGIQLKGFVLSPHFVHSWKTVRWFTALQKWRMLWEPREHSSARFYSFLPLKQLFSDSTPLKQIWYFFGIVSYAVFILAVQRSPHCWLICIVYYFKTIIVSQDQIILLYFSFLIVIMSQVRKHTVSITGILQGAVQILGIPFLPKRLVGTWYV